MVPCDRLTCAGVLVILVVGAGMGAAQGPAAPSPAPPAAARPGTTLTAAEIETFLLKARIVSKRSVSTGVTGTMRATLSDGSLTHDAQIQTVDISKTVFEAGRATEVGFRDSYAFNIAGYRLARLLGMDNVPISVHRTVDGKRSAVTWWIDDVMMDERERLAKKVEAPDPQRVARQLLLMRVFDELIQNRDRNQGNILWTKDWRLWLIDHTRAFRTSKDLLRPEQLTRVEAGWLARVRGLTRQTLEESFLHDGTLSRDQVEALLARRDRIVQHFEKRAATIGERAVYFSLE